ncbi:MULTISPECIES: hypothetical protein [unclassified Streptomyces]|uniref:hypothetical protein n=1 Tax=unclassified Streptomyces TaxID=2593676 RepID=UPI0037F3767E
MIERYRLRGSTIPEQEGQLFSWPAACPLGGDVGEVDAPGAVLDEDQGVQALE